MSLPHIVRILVVVYTCWSASVTDVTDVPAKRGNTVTDLTAAVKQHYAIANLGERILAALEAEGIDTNILNPEILAPIDQFHGRELAGTIDHAAMVEIGPETDILDLGCSVGGPARWLAKTFGCPVIGIDLTDEYIEAAKLLTERCGLEGQVSFHCCSALDLPFDDASFDIVWCQNATMNIEDRPSLYREIRRVLRSGGVYCGAEITQGPNGPVYYPTPWASDAEFSFLYPADDVRRMLTEAGFEIDIWQDGTTKRLDAAAITPPGHSLDKRLIAGDDYPNRNANSARSMSQNRSALIAFTAVLRD